MDISDPINSILLPGGNKVICRFSVEEVPQGWRLATPEELFLANLGYEFPWGKSPDPVRANRLWREKRIGMGGLVFDHWFKTSFGRYGGAKNVPLTVPNTLRYSLLLGGGECTKQELEANEGYAVVK